MCFLGPSFHIKEGHLKIKIRIVPTVPRGRNPAQAAPRQAHGGAQNTVPVATRLQATPPRQRLEAVPRQAHGSAQNTVPVASK